MLDLFLLHYQKAVMSTQAVIEEEVGLVAIETGPLNQWLLSSSSFAVRPREALSARFSFPGT